MKDIYKIGLLVVLTVLLTLGIQHLIKNRKKTNPPPTAGQLIEKRELTLVSQTNNYTDLSQVYRFRPLGTRKLLCNWKGNINLGIKIPEGYKWKIDYKEGVYNVEAPPLTVINVAIDSLICKKIRGGLLVDPDEQRNSLQVEYKNEVIKTANSLLKKDELKRIARLSLEDILLGLFSRANKELESKAVNVVFSDAPIPKELEE